MQRAGLLRLDAAYDAVTAPKDAALWQGVAAEAVLARVLAFVAMRAIRTHAHTQRSREHNADVHVECIHRAHWVSRQDELSGLIVGLRCQGGPFIAERCRIRPCPRWDDRLDRPPCQRCLLGASADLA